MSKRKLLILFALISVITSLSAQQNQKIESLLDSTSAYLEADSLSQAYKYAALAESDISKLNSISQKATYSNRLGYLFYKNNYMDKAEDYFLFGLSLYSELNDNDGKAKILVDLGNLKKNKEEYERAVELFLEAKKIKYNEGDNNAVAIIENNLGNLYLDWGRYDKAIKLFKNSIEQKKVTSNDNSLAITYLNLGSTYIKKGELEKAIYYLNNSYRLFYKSSNLSGIAKSLYNTGLAYKAMNNRKLALKFIEESLQYKKQLKDLNSLFGTYLTLAEIETQMNKREMAFNYLKLASDIVDETASLNLKMKLNMAYANQYEEFSDFRSSNYHYKKYLALKDSLFDIKTANKISELTAKFNAEEKEKEIERQSQVIEESENQIYVLVILALILIVIASVIYTRYIYKKRNSQELQAINEQLRKQQKELNELNATKDKFFSIIAHDLKNPIASFMMISELLKERINSLDDEKRLKFSKMLFESSISINNLLENLLEWSRSQTNSISYEPEEFNLEDLVSDNVKLLINNAEEKNIKIFNKLNNLPAVYADQNMIDTVIRNLLSNAIKFTPQEGRITIKNEIKDNYLHLYIEDTGVGIPEDKIGDLFKVDKNISTKGTNNETGTGLGLILTKDFLIKNKGDIKVESEINNGTVFNISIPLKM